MTLLVDHIADLSLEQRADEIFRAAPYLVDKLKVHGDLGQYSAKQGLVEVLKFLSLLGPDFILTPSHRVDLCWHQFILATQVYTDYCTKCYDKYLHHTPSNDSLGNQQQFDLCLTLYRQHYGTPVSWFWPQSALDWQLDLSGSCASCESSLRKKL